MLHLLLTMIYHNGSPHSQGPPLLYRVSIGVSAGLQDISNVKSAYKCQEAGLFYGHHQDFSNGVA